MPATQTSLVRRARDTDARAVVDLLASNHHLEIAFDPAQFMVAESDGRIIGCGRLKPLGDREHELASVIIAKSHRRTGIGRRLVDSLLRDAIGAVYALALEPAFFGRLGFRPMTVVPPVLVGKATSVCANSGFVPMQRTVG